MKAAAVLALAPPHSPPPLQPQIFIETLHKADKAFKLSKYHFLVICRNRGLAIKFTFCDEEFAAIILSSSNLQVYLSKIFYDKPNRDIANTGRCTPLRPIKFQLGREGGS